MFEFFTLIENLSKKLEIAFVIKEHPSDRVSDYRSLHEKQSEKIIFSTHSTQTLIENAQAILTINSSVAIESLLFNKKVIVLGEAFFAIDKIVKIANSQEVIFDILKNLQSWEVEKDVIKKFLLYLYVDYLIVDSWKNPTQRHFTMIENKFLEQK
jgi:capsular polysaccharide export protein